MYKFLNKWTRKLHRWGAVLIAVPLLIVILTGLLLQLKKQLPWVQPPMQTGSVSEPVVDWATMVQACVADSQAGIKSWADIDRLDVRPDRGIVKVQAKNRWELQLDLGTGEVLSSTYRRSDLIESLHDGTFFSEPAKLWIFLPNGLILLGLWFTGVYLWYLPFLAKRRKQKKAKSKL